MGPVFGGEAGGIVWLTERVREWGTEIERELIDLGLRLRDFPADRSNWRDLYVIVMSPKPGGFLFHLRAESLKQKDPGQPTPAARDNKNVANLEDIIRDFA